MGAIEGSGIVWDGDSEVRTSNIFQDTELTRLFDPAALAINVTLTGDDAVDILLRLIVTPDLTNASGFVPPSDWYTLDGAAPDALDGEFNEVDSGNAASAGDLAVVARFLDFNVTGSGLINVGSADKAALSALLADYSGLSFYLGIAAVIRPETLADGTIVGSMAPGALITFDVSTGLPPTPQPVPEPSTILLLGTGAMTVLGRRFRRA
jgi:PEP-CTERM putative exosortase interaction domain